jgi:hypothetical protein
MHVYILCEHACIFLLKKKRVKNNNNKNRRAYIELNQFEVVCNVNVFRNYLFK